LRIIIETIKNLGAPLGQVAGILFVIFYLFAQLGIYRFGGLNFKGNVKVGNDPSVP